MKAQIAITGSQTAAALASALVGSGVIVTNPTLNCNANANGYFVRTGNSNLGIDSGIILTSGRAATAGSTAGANGPASLFPSYGLSLPGDAQLTALSGVSTHDACILEFDFEPAGDTVKFDYVFSSEEYFGYSCTVFNDVFGFFISGPGIVGAKNLAVIPGTNIPVAVNSTTNPQTVGQLNTALCNAMGTGSPFTQYFVNNQNGQYVTHDGFTTVFKAISAVIPCSTYHLKLAIADGSDGILDSGTWIKAGSLTSNAISVKGVGGGGLSTPRPYAVRGCLPGTFVFQRPSALSTPLTIKYQITGTAANGIDYTLIPDSVVIGAGQKQAVRIINAIPVFPAAGLKTVKLRIYNPYSCGAPQVIDSAELDIYDSLFARVLTNDTSICEGQSVTLQAIGDAILNFKWKPSNTVSDSTSLTTIATPTVSTWYELEASLPSSGCPPAHDYVKVDVRFTPTVNVGPDRTTCLNTAVQLNAVATPAGQPYTYTWTPATGLSSTTVADPIANPVVDAIYYLKVNPGAIGCDGFDTINVRVLPNDFELNNPDTAICKGDYVQVRAIGHPEFSYVWNPTKGVNLPFKIDPELRPDTPTTYVITARYPGCPDMVHQFHVDVQPVPDVFAGLDREKCQWDTLHLHANVEPGWYKFDLTWSPANAISLGFKEPDAIFIAETTTDMQLLATTPAGCRDSDIVTVVVHPGNFARVQPEAPWGVCPNDSLHIMVTGGAIYRWSPDEFINNTNTGNITVYPTMKTTYTALITDAHNCHDTVILPVNVYPEAIADFGDEYYLHPGESIQMDPKGNCFYYEWFPHVGLTAYNISNPVASPEVNTRYVVKASTENGCTTVDSIDIWRVRTTMDLPNAFVPGNSKDLKIIKQGIATLKYFRIFNRWGVKVFETTDVNQGWDGTFNGEPQPVGVYVYDIQALTDTGESYSKQGNVTLIR